MAIKLLNDDLINKIAAGEVIERPASIVKELIENSLDANASKINVAILNGGKDYIEVEDDGIGLSKEELPLAFLRHATSKISEEKDLYNICTMGFRGEALPSIASVSKVTVFSSQADNAGTRAEIEGGEFKSLESFPCPQGTRIIVSDLFYNTPARKNFLKSTVTEGNAVYEMVIKYAVARPDISFSFKKDNKQYFKTPGNGNVQDAVRAVFGHDFADSLIYVDYKGDYYAINGLISSPDYTKGNRKSQYFFVNSRPIRSPILYKAIDAGYQGLLISKEYPVVILSINLPPENVDVNVHPQKSEVRFKDEKGIFNVVYQVIRDRLTNIDYNPVHKLNVTADIETTYMDKAVDKYPNQVFEPVSPRQVYNNSFKFAEPISAPKLEGTNESPAALASYIITTAKNKEETNYTIIGCYDDTYILMEYDDALWLIDQHAAEERIIYNKLKKQYENNESSSQLLAFPLTLDLSAKDVEIITENKETFNRLGFSMDLLGHDTIVIRNAPAICLGQEKELVLEIIELLKDGKNVDIYDESLITMACKKAIKAGQRLNFYEMETLVQDLLKTEDYKNCPHGRPTLIKLNKRDIEQMFKR